MAVNIQNVGSLTLTDYLQQMMLQSNDDTNYHYFHTYDDYTIMYRGILNHKTTKIVRDRDTNFKWYRWINFIHNRLIW